MKKLLILFTMTVTFLALVGCGDRKSADTTIQNKQEQMQAEAVRQNGLPNITRFTEMRRLCYLYELRDRADLTTWIYTRDMHGKLHLIGIGMGFPIPYGTQYSNPQKITWEGSRGWKTMPQSEPTGIFPPSTAEATWVILMTKRGPKPYYAETRLEGLPERVPNADETNAIWPDGKAIPPDVQAPPAAKDSDVKALYK